jgi:hypothetical protein
VTFTVELYAAPDRLCGCHLVDAPDGATAVRAAADDVAANGCDFAELFVPDGAGGTHYYTTVEAR